MTDLIARHTTERLLLERVTLVGPNSDWPAVHAELTAGRWHVTRQGPLSTPEGWDPERFCIIAQREVVKRC